VRNDLRRSDSCVIFLSAEITHWPANVCVRTFVSCSRVGEQFLSLYQPLPERRARGRVKRQRKCERESEREREREREREGERENLGVLHERVRARRRRRRFREVRLNFARLAREMSSRKIMPSQNAETSAYFITEVTHCADDCRTLVSTTCLCYDKVQMSLQLARSRVGYAIRNALENRESVDDLGDTLIFARFPIIQSCTGSRTNARVQRGKFLLCTKEATASLSLSLERERERE